MEFLSKNRLKKLLTKGERHDNLTKLSRDSKKIKNNLKKLLTKRNERVNITKLSQLAAAKNLDN